MVSLAKFAPIGSVVRIQESKFVIVGHRMAREDDKVGVCYVLVPYPLGFMKADSLTLTPASKVDEVLCAGFTNSEGLEYLSELESAGKAIEGIDYHDYADAVLCVGNYVNEAGDRGE